MSKELTKRDEIISAFSNEKTQEALSAYYDNNPKAVLRFLSSIRMCFRSTPKLMNCTKESLIDVFTKCAEWGLYPSVETGQCYVIPYGTEAKFQLGYQGMIELAYRAEKTKRISAEIIYSNDKFTRTLGIDQKFIHESDPFGEKGEPIGAYAIAILDSGEAITKTMSKAEIFELRDKSPGYKADLKYKKQDSPWQPKNDPQLNMWKKTCIRQLFKIIPKTPEAIAALNESEKTEIIDITPKSDNMPEKDVSEFYKRIKKIYPIDLIQRGIEEELEQETLEPLTADKAEQLETWLKTELNKDLDKKAEQEQGELL